MADSLSIVNRQCSARLQHEPYRGREPLPIGLLLLQIFAPCRSQRIELRPAIVVRLTPLRPNPSALLEAMEGRIKRSLIHLEHFLRHLPDALRDAPAVHRFKSNSLQD